MNIFDYFFENTSALRRSFLVGKEEITFKELFGSSLNLAGWLKENIGENKKIIILSANNLFFLKTYLAILKSGNICIPLDPAIEEENFRYICEKTDPALLFITPEVKRKLPVDNLKCILPDLIEECVAETEPNTPDTDFDRESCAEIIFTSGSTGKPKGVMISHKNLQANTSSIIDYLGINERDRMLVVLPFYYCYGLSLLHTHLRTGGSIVFNNSFIFLGAVINNLIEYKCTGFAGVPSHFQIILRKSDTFKNSSFPDLRYVTQAGGKLATSFIDEFRESHPEIDFYVMYGQTEATARLSYLPPGLYNEKKGSIGKGIPGVELKLVNESGIEIKPGETGEVIARGDNIMMGYYSDPEGTNEALKNEWLHTGDLGTIDEDGFIYLTARKKEILKVGGKRISPKEIEAVILQIQGVIDCSIEGVDDELQGEALKATIVVNKDHEDAINEEMVKQHCTRHLAMYKVPHLYEFRNQIVMSATGKKIKGS